MKFRDAISALRSAENKFEQTIAAHLFVIGACPVHKNIPPIVIRSYHQFIDTNIGKVGFTVHSNSISCAFEDRFAGHVFTKRACPYNLSDKETGQWNWSYGPQQDHAILCDPSHGTGFSVAIDALLCYHPSEADIQEANKLREEWEKKQ